MGAIRPVIFWPSKIQTARAVQSVARGLDPVILASAPELDKPADGDIRLGKERIDQWQRRLSRIRAPPPKDVRPRVTWNVPDRGGYGRQARGRRARRPGHTRWSRPQCRGR